MSRPPRHEVIERLADPIPLIQIAHVLGFGNLRELRNAMARAGIRGRRWTTCGVPIIEAKGTR